MLTMHMENGSTRNVNTAKVEFDEMGITFTNTDQRCRECVTFDKIKSFSYAFEVTEMMQDKSRKLQFRASDERGGGSNTLMNMG